MSEQGHCQHGHGAHAPHSPHANHAPNQAGGDGNTLAQVLGLANHQHGGHNFLAHLLGLDHDAHGQHGHGMHGQHGATSVSHNPSQSTSWTSALQSVKLSDALQGINVTPNFLFILLFVGFASWLFVIYWVRHHEPLANSVLGTAAAHSATAAADRRMLAAGTKTCFPVRTCKEMGDIYVPVPGAPTAMPGSAANAATAVGMPMPAPPLPAPAPEPQPMPLSPYGSASQPGMYVPAYGSVQQNAYMVPEQQPAGTRVKMIVNR